MINDQLSMINEMSQIANFKPLTENNPASAPNHKFQISPLVSI